MEGAGVFLHRASWWCKGTCCQRKGIMSNLGDFFLDIDIGIGHKVHSFQC